MGNISLLLHYIVQVQFHFAIIQSINAIISWRNINLISSEKPASKKTVLLSFFLVVALTIIVFLAQSYFVIGEIDWVRTPKKPWDSLRQHHSAIFHLFGTLGAIILSSRFWVQWWMAENKKFSDLDETFWYLSILGSIILVIYAIQISDFVVLFYNCFGLVPYFRNLMLLRKPAQPQQKG